MYFPLGGGSLKGIGKPGEIVWSRVFVEGGALHADLGRGTVVSLPAAETERRWKQTTYAMADCACRLPRRQPESIHGAPPRQPCERGVCAFSGDGRQGSCDQGRHACGSGHHRASVRKHAVKLRAAMISSVERTRPRRGKMRSMEFAWLSAVEPVMASSAKIIS